MPVEPFKRYDLTTAPVTPWKRTDQIDGYSDAVIAASTVTAGSGYVAPAVVTGRAGLLA